jgi:hypothetical protein
VHKPIPLIAAAMTFAIVLMFSVSADAKPRPYISDPDAAMGICLGDGGDNNWGTSNDPDNPYGCAGLICYCCYDDGCYICDNTGYDCVWDGKASRLSINRRLRALGLPTIRPTTADPGLRTRPPRVKPIAPGILEGGGTLLPQGPAPTGRPTAPPPPPPVQLR